METRKDTNREEYEGKLIATLRKPIIAIVGDIGTDWAAYMGEEGWSMIRTIEYGNKLPQEVAEFLFPEWAETHTYRK